MSTEPLTLCKLFARCVRRTPDNLAVDHEHGCLTYNELDAASSRVANNLAKLGVKHGSPVLLFTAPGTLNVVAVLGILKIGASFVPIDRRTWSTDKVRYVMEMVDSSAIVNTTGESFPATSNHRILDLREVPKGLVDEAEAPIGRQVMPEDVACIIFTSGSTGRPKGVLLTHDSISLYAQTSLFNMDVRPGDRVLHILSVAFDAYTCVFFSVLGNSGTLVPASMENMYDRAATCTIIASTPSLLATLPRPSVTEKNYPSVHTVILGGETAPQELLIDWSDVSVRVLNAYGPSETTCTGSVHVVERCEETGQIRSAIIGTPMEQSPVYIVDEHLNPVEADDVDGEIIISGRSLAKGYYKDEVKTQQNFVVWRDTRVYRTGDYGRWVRSGKGTRVIEFRGRIDRTVKNRGFLVNLEADVEAPLRTMGFGVKQVYAIMSKSHLVAVVTPADVDVDGLRRRMRQQCCSFHVPDRIEAVENLPLSSNSKVQPKEILELLLDIDAERMRKMNSTNTAGKTNGAGSPHLAVVATCMAEALGLGPTELGLDDNFFELGGQSLAALKLASLCRSHGIRITIRDIYTFQTVETVAEHATELTTPSATTCQPDPAAGDFVKDQVKASLGLAEDEFEAGPLTNLQLELALPTLDCDGKNTNQLRLTYESKRASTVESAWRQVWEAEPIFRTEICLHVASGVQIIHRQALSEPRSLAFESKEQYHAAVEQAEIAVGLGCRLELFTYTPCEFDEQGEITVVLTVHHCLMDGYSWSLILGKVEQAAKGMQISSSTSFLEACSELIRLQNEGDGEAKRFWNDYLENVQVEEPGIPAPFKFDTAALAKELTFNFPGGAQDLKAFAAKCTVTLPALYYTAWGMAMAKLTGSNTVVVGAVFSGRETQLQYENTIGPLIATLPLVLELGPEASAHVRLRQTMAGLARISQYTWVRPDQIQHRPRNLLAMQADIPGSEAMLSPIRVKAYENSDFPLSLLVEENASFRLVYDGGLFSDETAIRIADHFKEALGSLIHDSTISACVPSGGVDKGAVAPKAPEIGQRRKHQTVKSAFEESVDRHSDLIALEDTAGTMTYAQLDARADMVAHRIREQTPTPKTVAIHGDGSMNWIVGLVGILKAGSTYCPLDPAWPPDLRASVYSCSDSSALLLPNSGHCCEIPLSGIEVLVVEEVVAEGTNAGERFPDDMATNEDFAIVFTSGTTGKPKGVPISHRGFLALQSNPEATLFSAPGRKFAQFMSPAFDCCANEIFSALLHGGTLVLKEPGNPYANLKRADTAFITPSMMSSLDPAEYPNISIICATGEPVTAALVDKFAPRRLFYNGYGPAECSICVSYTRLRPGELVTIGRALPTARMYVLDAGMQHVPVGAEGEIFVAGEQVMRGYIGADEETARRITADPWHPNERMYRTGDYGRLTAKGTVEYIGRLDRQVKIRGFRVELAGVERKMYTLGEDVVLAAAFAVNDTLVALVTPSTVDVGRLRQALEKALPPSWVPQVMMAVNEFPMTANKKMDYRALEKLVRATVEAENGQHVELEGVEEEMVAEEWKQVLKLDVKTQFSAHADFLRLGGHSLLQMQLAARLSAAFGVQVAMRNVIGAPRLRDQAAMVRRLRHCGSDDYHTTTTTAYIALPEHALNELERQVWFQYQVATAVTAFNIATVLRIEGPVQHGRLVEALNTALAWQAVLRSSFAEGDGGPVRTLWAKPPRVCEVAQLNIKSEVNRPFDLARDELVRLHLVGGRTIVLLTTHVIADLNSVQNLLHLASTAYMGRPLPSPLAHDHAASAVWWRRASAVERRFWTDYLRGYQPRLALARQPTLAAFEGESRVRHHCGQLVVKLEALLARFGVTRHQLALAAVGQTLQWLTGVDDVVLGAPFENRPTALERASLGLFLDRLPVRIQGRPPAGSACASLLEAARDSSQQAIAHAIPFSQLLQVLDERPTTAPARHPVFECVVTFHLRDAIARCLDLPGCSVHAIPHFAQGSKFLIMFEWTETAPGSWGLRIEYDSCRLSASTVDAIERALDVVLAAFADNCSCTELRTRLSRLPPLQHQDPRAWTADRVTDTICREMSLCLGVDDFPCSASFFAAGADSLAALTLRRRLKRAGIDLRLQQMFHLQTPQKLAQYLVECL